MTKKRELMFSIVRGLLAILIALLVLMAADYAITIACVLTLNRRLSGLDDAAKRMRTVSDSLSRDFGFVMSRHSPPQTVLIGSPALRGKTTGSR